MKKIVLSLSLSTLVWSGICFAHSVPNPFPPFHIAGNLYYVGTDDVASYLVVTPEGNILINSDYEENVPMIQASIEKLGFDYADTKILLISHAHFDHVAGSQLIKQQTHAIYMVMDADVPVIESGGKLDFQYAKKAWTHYPPTKVDRVLHDGDTVVLGGSILTAHLTPGHTKGCTTWTMELKEEKQHYQAVIVGSLNVNAGYKLVDNPNYPNLDKDFEYSFNTLKSLHCDIFLGSHASQFNLDGKYNLLSNSTTNPFLDPQGYKKYIAHEEHQFNIKLEDQKHQNT